MIKLNRTTEYGLIALRHMSRRQAAEVTSAREVADAYGLPFEITAKTLQRLKDTGLIQSSQGARGGYTLKRALKEVSLADFLVLMEGPQAVVACCVETESKQAAGAEADPACDYHSACEIKHVMNDLNSRVHQFLSGIRLADLTTAPLNLVQLGKFAGPGSDGSAAIQIGEEP